MTVKLSLDRVAFSPGEFAKLFGKSQTWGYRQIYGGKVKAITEHGRILIPAGEVDAILKSAGVYDGLKPKTAKSKAEIQKLAPRLQNAWQSFLAARRQSPANAKMPAVAAEATAKWPAPPSGRQAALARLTRKPESREKAR